MGRRVLRGTRIPGPKVFASIVTEGAENEFSVLQLTDVAFRSKPDKVVGTKATINSGYFNPFYLKICLKLPKWFSKIFKTIPSLKLT